MDTRPAADNRYVQLNRRVVQTTHAVTKDKMKEQHMDKKATVLLTLNPGLEVA